MPRRLPAIAFALAAASAVAADAAEISRFYQADAIVTGTDLRQRPWGFAQCLREVLVKVSGDPRLRHDPRVDALAAHAERFVTAFGYVDMYAGIPKNDDQGFSDRPHRLTVFFDPIKIAAVLAEFGERPWAGERPVVVPVLLVAGPRPPPYVLTADDPQRKDQRDALAEAAGEFGLGVRLPSEADIAAWGLGGERSFSERPPPASTAAEQVIVVGTLAWNEALPGWVGQWHTRWHDADHHWGVRGVNYDAAFRNIMQGALLLASGRGTPD